MHWNLTRKRRRRQPRAQVTAGLEVATGVTVLRKETITLPEPLHRGPGKPRSWTYGACVRAPRGQNVRRELNGPSYLHADVRALDHR